MVSEVGTGGPVVDDSPPVRVIRSDRRRRTVSARREGSEYIVRVPASMPAAEVDRWVAVLVGRLARRSRHRVGDDELERRAAILSRRYLGGRAVPRSVRWVENQQFRWGSCTPAEGTVRISARVREMPSYVLDYVLLHELAHLLEPHHGPAFKSLTARYEKDARAAGFLEGWLVGSAGQDVMSQSDDLMECPG